VLAPIVNQGQNQMSDKITHRRQKENLHFVWTFVNQNSREWAKDHDHNVRDLDHKLCFFKSEAKFISKHGDHILLEWYDGQNTEDSCNSGQPKIKLKGVEVCPKYSEN